MPSSTSNLWTPHQHRDPLGKQLGTHCTSAFWEKSEAPLPPPMRRCHFIHPKQLSPFPERLQLPYPNGEILSSYDEDVSFIRDHFTAWVKAGPNDTLERHMVDVRKAFAEFREASVQRQEASPQEYFFDRSVLNRSSFQKRPSVYNWNPGTLGLYIMQPDKVEVEPCFVVAALIIRAQAQDIAVNRESTMKPYLPLSIRFRRFKKPTHVSPIARNRSGSHNGVGPGGIGRAQSAKASSMTLILLLLSRRHAAPLKSPATRSTFSLSITARIVRMSFFPMPRFLA